MQPVTLNRSQRRGVADAGDAGGGAWGGQRGSRGWAPQWLGARERGRVRVGVGADPVCGAAGVREKGEGEGSVRVLVR